MLRIKEICKNRGVTTVWLANEIGMLQPSLSRVINGGNTTIETLKEIAKALDVPISELFEAPANNIITCPKCKTKLKIDECL